LFDMAATSTARTSLSRERVLRAAVELADASGIEALTMRRLADALGAEAMSLYYHVTNKDDVLDGIVDVVASDINAAVDQLERSISITPATWKQAVRQRILRAREVLLCHRWAPAVFETRRETSPAVLRYLDGLVKLMREGGFSNDQIHHALHALGSRALGFTQELFDPGGRPASAPTEAMLDVMGAQFAHLADMLREVAHDDPESTLGWCDDQTEFEFGLDLILDGLDRLSR
jgi:AcrR family transcriptional regulator